MTPKEKIMTPKEKAKELINKYKEFTEDNFAESYYNAKQCALIAVDEILSTRPGSPYPQDVGLVVNGVYNIINYPEKYWQEVKQEIKLL